MNPQVNDDIEVLIRISSMRLQELMKTNTCHDSFIHPIDAECRQETLIPRVHGDIEVLERIRAMRLQELKTNTCNNYFTPLVNAECREAMVGWFFTICDALDLSRITVWNSMSILDRYVSSRKGKSNEALQTKAKYQLATITSFYIAAKVHESCKLGIEMLVKLSRGFYSQGTIFDMEREILQTLEWRVYGAPTPLEYVRQFLELLPEVKDISNAIIEKAMFHNDRATSDVYFSGCKASAVGIVCFSGALNDISSHSSFEKDLLWKQLSTKLDFDIASNEIREVELKLLGTTTSRKPRRASRVDSLRGSLRCSITALSSSDHQPPSPVSVMLVA